MTSSGSSPAPLLVVAVVVLLAGLTAAVVHDDKRSPTRSTSSSSAHPATSAPATTGGAGGATSSSRSSAGPPTSVATTVRPPVTSPEAAVNGLWAAYAANNQVAAQRFATEDVIRVLFQVQYDGQRGTFQGCRPNNDTFDCEYLQPSTRYAMTVERDTNNGFLVTALTVSAT